MLNFLVSYVVDHSSSASIAELIMPVRCSYVGNMHISPLTSLDDPYSEDCKLSAYPSHSFMCDIISANSVFIIRLCLCIFSTDNYT